MRGGGQTLSSTPRESIAQQVVQDAEPLPGSLMGDTIQKVASLKSSLQTLAVDQRTKDEFLKSLNWIELNEAWYQCLPDAAIKIIEDVLLQLLELAYGLLSEQFLCLQILKMCNSFSRVVVIYYTEHGEMDQDKLKQLRDIIEAMKVSIEDQAETTLYHNGLQYEIEIVSGCLGMLLIEDKQGKALAMNLVKSIVISAVLMNPADDLFSSLADLAAFGVRTLIKKRKQKHLKEIITKCIFIEQLRWSIVMAVQQQPLRVSALLGKIVGIYEKHVKPCKQWQVKYCWIKCMHQIMTHKIMITKYRIEKQNTINSIDLIDQWNDLVGGKAIYTMFRHQDFVGIVNEISIKESNQLSQIIIREIRNLTLIRSMIIEGTDQLPQLLALAQLLTNQSTEMDTEAVFVQRKLQSLKLGAMAAHFNQITSQAQNIFDAYMNLQYDLELFQESSQQKNTYRNTQQIQLQLKALTQLIDDYCQSLIRSKIWTLYLKDVTVKIRALIPKDRSPQSHVLKHISFELNSIIKQSIKTDYPPYKQAWQAYLMKELQKIHDTLTTINPRQDRLLQLLQSMMSNPSIISILIIQFNEIVQQITGRITLGGELSVQMQIQCDELSDLEFTLCDQVKAGWHITKILGLEQLDFKVLTNIWTLHQLERFVGVANRQNIIKTQVLQIEDLLNILCQDSRIVHQIYTLDYDLSPTVEERLTHLSEEVRLKWMLITIRKQASNSLSELVLGQLQTQVIKLQGQEIQRFNDHFVNLLHLLESTYNIASDSQQKELPPPAASATSKFLASLPGHLDQIIFRLHSAVANLKNIQNKYSKDFKIFKEQLQELPQLDIKENKYLDYIFSIYENSIDISPSQIISDCKIIINTLTQASIVQQEYKINFILTTINLFLTDQGLVQLTASLQLVGKKLKQSSTEISEQQINYITLKGQQLSDIDIGCISNIISTGKQYIEILSSLCEQLSNSEIVQTPNQPLRQSKHQHSMYVQDLSAQRDSDLNDLYQVQRNLEQIMRYHECFSVSYQRLNNELTLISSVQAAQEVHNKIEKLGILFQQNYKNFINGLELDNDLRIETIIDKSLQVVQWDMSFLERIHEIAPESKLKSKVKQLLQSKQKKNSWRLKECELFYIMIMQTSIVDAQWREQYGCRLVSAKVLETDLRIQKLLASRDFLMQTQANLDQYWQQQSQSVQASIERQLLQLGLIQRQIKSQQNEEKRQNLIRQHKELEFEIDCQIENTKSVGDALGIAVAFLKDLKKQLSAIQDQLEALTEKIDEIGLDLKFLRGKTARQLMELRMVSVLQNKTLEDTNSIYVPLMSKEWDFEAEADMSIATPIFNTDNSDQGEVDEFISNKLQTSLLIHGNAGCGKSTAARKIEEYLWLNYQSKPHSWNDINSPALLPIYVQLPMLKDPKFGAMQEALLGQNYRFDARQMSELQEAVQKGFIRLIIIMDSYDELNQEFIGLNLNISNKLALWKSNNFLKVITTSRTEIFTRTEYRDWFVVEGKATQKYFKEIRIMPFDYEQRSEFMRQHCRLAVKQQVIEIYEVLCDARKDVQKLIEEPWKDIERLLEFSDQQRLLTQNQIDSLIQILKRDPQISLYDEQEKHLKQQLSRLWPIVYFDRSIEQLGIQRLVESPYMTKIVVQVLPNLIMQFSQQEHIKPIFLRKYVGNHKNSVWEWLIDQKFFTVYQVTMQWVTVKKLFTNTLPEFIENTDLIIEALQANKPVSFDFYELFFQSFVESQLEKLSLQKVQVQRRDIWEYARQMAIQMTNDQLTQVAYEQVGIMAQSNEGKFFNLFDAQANHAEHKSVIRRLLPLKIRGDQYSFQHKSIQEYLFASDVIRLLNQDTISEKQLEDHNINKQCWQLEFFIGATNFIAEKVKNNEVQVQRLLSFVKLSSKNDQLVVSASNSLLLLRLCEIDLRGCDFSGIRIEGISLRGCVMCDCNLNGSRFCNVDINGINLTGANLSNCKWVDLITNELPLIRMAHQCTSITYSTDQSKIYTCNSQGLYCLESQTCKIVDQPQLEQSVIEVITNQEFLIYSTINKVTIMINQIIYKELVIEEEIVKICFSNKQVAIATNAFTVHIWNINNEKSNIIYTSNDIIKGMCFVKQQLFINTEQSIIPVFQPDLFIKAKVDFITVFDNQLITISGKQLQRWADGVKSGEPFTNQETILCISCTPNNKIIAIGDKKGFITLLSANKWEQSQDPFKAHYKNVQAICFSPDCKFMATCGGDRGIQIWDSQGGQQQSSKNHHIDRVKSVTYNLDGSMIISGGGQNDGTIRRWDAKNGKSIGEAFRVGGSVQMIDCNELYIAAAVQDKLHIWDITNHKSQILTGSVGKIHAITLLQNMLISGGAGGEIIEWNLKLSNYIKYEQGLIGGDCLYIGIIQNQLFSVVKQGILFWKDRICVKQHQIKIHSASNDSTQIAIATEKDVNVMDFRLNLMGVLKGHEKKVEAIDIKGQLIVTCSNDKTVRVWKDFQQIYLYTSRKAMVVKLSPSLEAIVVGKANHSIEVWNLKEQVKGEDILTMKTPTPNLVISNTREKTLYNNIQIKDSLIQSRLGIDVLSVWKQKTDE